MIGCIGPPRRTIFFNIFPLEIIYKVVQIYNDVIAIFLEWKLHWKVVSNFINFTGSTLQ